LSDGLNIKKDVTGKAWLCVLVIAPSFLLALVYPNIFLAALNYAGAFGAVILFGVLPALMVWAGRYREGLGTKPLVPGGKIVLLGIIGFALWIMIRQVIL
jgi:tyrosine-specific transport protein